MSDVKSFFEKRTHHHAYHRDPSSYSEIIDSIKRTIVKDRLNILDVGCGDGSFIRALNRSKIDGNVIGIDLSYNMALQAVHELGDKTAALIVGDGFSLPLRTDSKFDLIHLDSVLHHLIAGDKQKSKLLAKKLLSSLHGRLSDQGIIIIEEMYYNSFVFPEVTSTIIFYGLKLINILGLDLSKARKEFQPGLEVNFFSENGLQKLFSQISENFRWIKRTPLEVPSFYRLFLLRNLGHISYVINN